MSRTLKLYLLISVASSLDSDLQQLGDELTNPGTTEIINRIQSELPLIELEKLLITLAYQVHTQKKSPEG